MQAWGDHFSCYADTMEEPDVLKPGSSENSMGDWNTSGEPVTIGAYVADNRIYIFGELISDPDEVIGRYAKFSSYGHDFSTDHHAYPDVCAPGYSIYAATNSFDTSITPYGKATYSNQFKGQDQPRDYPYTFMSGTSMATPAAAGIIALWMQAAQDKGKTLTNSDIKDIIRHTSDTDDFTKQNPLRYGAGKINAYKGLLYVLGLPTGIDGLSQHQPAGVSFRLSDGLLYIDGAEDGTPVSLYNLQGVCVSQTAVKNGIVSLNALQKGSVYAVQLGKLGSTLIRL